MSLSLARKTPRKALGALLLSAGLGHLQRQQELCLDIDCMGQGRGPGWELLFQGFGTGLLNSSLIPLMTTCPGKEGSPLFVPHFPRGSRCQNWLSGGSKVGISMTLKGRGQPWGHARGMQVTRDGDSSDLMPNDCVRLHPAPCTPLPQDGASSPSPEGTECR